MAPTDLNTQSNDAPSPDSNHRDEWPAFRVFWAAETMLAFFGHLTKADVSAEIIAVHVLYEAYRSRP